MEIIQKKSLQMPNPPGSATHHTAAIPHIRHLQQTMYIYIYIKELKW